MDSEIIITITSLEYWKEAPVGDGQCLVSDPGTISYICNWSLDQSMLEYLSYH